MDNTAGHIASAFEYGHDVHASALENVFPDTMSRKENIIGM